MISSSGSFKFAILTLLIISYYLHKPNLSGGCKLVNKFPDEVTKHEFRAKNDSSESLSDVGSSYYYLNYYDCDHSDDLRTSVRSAPGNIEKSVQVTIYYEK